MTLFEDDRYNWRETYFVYFESSHRPKLTEVRRALKISAPLLSILDSKAESQGHLVAMTIASYENHAAMEMVYREGNDVLLEAQHLVRSLKEEATPKELAQLQKIVRCKTRFDIHHFEQTAGTGVFQVKKLPELKFSKQTASLVDRGDVFLKALGQDTPSKEKFHFDPNSYNQCRHARLEDMDISDRDSMDTGELERIDPEMLVTVLEILCRISHGVVVDPASGMVLE